MYHNEPEPPGWPVSLLLLLIILVGGCILYGLGHVIPPFFN